MRRRVAVVLGLFVWFSCAWFGAAEWNPNNATRLAAAVSMVEDGDATIDEYDAITIDKARFGDHVYMDKAPGMTLLALPWVWVADRVTGDVASNHAKAWVENGIWGYLRLRLRLAAAFGPAILTALAAVAMLSLGSAIGGSAEAGLFAALGYALGSTVWGWSTTLFGHAAVADLTVIALWAAWRVEPRRWAMALAGAALGWAVTTEVTAVLWGGVVAALAVARVWRRPDRTVLVGTAAAAGIAALLPLAAYNQYAFGTPFRFGYSGVVGFAGMQQGYFGLTWPHLDLIPRLLFGTFRGLFWVAPVLLLGPFGIAWLIRQPKTRDLGAACAVIAVGALLYNASYFYWDGGHSTGPRHLVPAIGPLALGLAAVWPMLEGRERSAAGALLGISIALNLAIAAADIAAPDQFTAPLWQHILPKFWDGDIRSFGTEALGWSPGLSIAIWGAVAAIALIWLVKHCRGGDENVYRTDGATRRP